MHDFIRVAEKEKERVGIDNKRDLEALERWLNEWSLRLNHVIIMITTILINIIHIIHYNYLNELL